MIRGSLVVVTAPINLRETQLTLCTFDKVKFTTIIASRDVEPVRFTYEVSSTDKEMRLGPVNGARVSTCELVIVPAYCFSPVVLAEKPVFPALFAVRVTVCDTGVAAFTVTAVSYTHLRAHETRHDLV